MILRIYASFTLQVLNYLLFFSLQKQKPYFYEETVYVIPLSLSLTSVPGDCNHVQLSVAVWLSQTPTPTEWMTLEKDFCLSPDSFSGLPPPPKTVTKQSCECNNKSTISQSLS